MKTYEEFGREYRELSNRLAKLNKDLESFKNCKYNPGLIISADEIKDIINKYV